jgi:uncharacterized membrane protein YkvA (DUF1232 family)
LLLRRPEVPWPAKIAGGCAIAYIFSPIQLIPNWIPLVGQMDDLLVLLLGTKVIRKFTPPTILRDCEARVEFASPAQVKRREHSRRDPRQQSPPVAASTGESFGGRLAPLPVGIAVVTRRSWRHTRDCQILPRF